MTENAAPAEAKAGDSQPPWNYRAKCRAGMIAGGVTGLIAGVGVVIAVAKALPLENTDWEWLEWVLGAGLIVAATVGGLFTGAIAGGCYGEKP